MIETAIHVLPDVCVASDARKGKHYGRETPWTRRSEKLSRCAIARTFHAL